MRPVLTMPRVHLNGTSRGELQEQYENAYRALTDAMQVVAHSHPNARDYYVLPPDRETGRSAYQCAHDDHEARMQRLRDVQGELLAIYEHLAG